MEIQVTAALLRVMNGCAATEQGQRVWLKLCGAGKGTLIPMEAAEARFIHSWVADSISVAEELSVDAGMHGERHERAQISRELGALRRVQALLPARQQMRGRSGAATITSASGPTAGQ